MKRPSAAPSGPTALAHKSSNRTSTDGCLSPALQNAHLSASGASACSAACASAHANPSTRSPTVLVIAALLGARTLPHACGKEMILKSTAGQEFGRGWGRTCRSARGPCARARRCHHRLSPSPSARDLEQTAMSASPSCQRGPACCRTGASCAPWPLLSRVATDYKQSIVQGHGETCLVCGCLGAGDMEDKRMAMHGALCGHK